MYGADVAVRQRCHWTGFLWLTLTSRGLTVMDIPSSSHFMSDLRLAAAPRSKSSSASSSSSKSWLSHCRRFGTSDRRSFLKLFIDNLDFVLRLLTVSKSGSDGLRDLRWRLRILTTPTKTKKMKNDKHTTTTTVIAAPTRKILITSHFVIRN